MTPRQFNIGDQVYYGERGKAGAYEAEVIGFTDFKDGFYYVLKSPITPAFIRREEDLLPIPETTLPEYIAAYIKHELSRRAHSHLNENLDTWVANAFEAYEEGAR